MALELSVLTALSTLSARLLSSPDHRADSSELFNCPRVFKSICLIFYSIDCSFHPVVPFGLSHLLYDLHLHVFWSYFNVINERKTNYFEKTVASKKLQFLF